MADISYGLQLTSTPVDSGPDYNVFSSLNCTDYTFKGVITLETTESIDYLTMDESASCIKLQSRGNCLNEVVSGSTPSSSSYNTHIITLTQKNGAGPEFIVSETSGSLFTFLETVELGSQGATVGIEPDYNTVGIRLRSSGTCNTSVTKNISGSAPPPSPTPTPTPGPTPTPSPTPGPTATPAPTPASCFAVDMYQSDINATDACCNVFATVAHLNGTSLLTATVAYESLGCSTVLSTPTWMTQDTNSYYYWNGSSFTGPTSCPGCP